MNLRTLIAVMLVCCGLPASAAAQQITIAAAADLQSAMQEIAARFHKETGMNVRVIYGSSGNFFQQIQNGAPFDLFFSANVEYPKKLEGLGFVEPGTLYRYATGKIVLWVPRDSRLDISNGLPSLLNPAIAKVAIANPEHAPYGQAAVAALKKQTLYDKVSRKFVFGENISQAASFVISGAADAGIIALSLARSPNMKDKGRYVEISANDYPAIEQACVVLGSSKQKGSAKAFLNFVKSPAVQQMLQAYGFAVPVTTQQ